VKITINKESAIPIRDQLIEQVGLQIAAGILKHKEKLPSIRALAQRLGIHYSTVTAAYNHLAEVGLLDIRQGSGVRVAGRTNANEGSGRDLDLDSMVCEFLAKVAERGYSRAQLLTAYEKIGSQPPIRRILAVDGNVDFHPILLSELKPQFKLPVETCTIEQLKKSKHDDALIITSLYHLFAFQEFISDPTRLVVCNIEPGRAEIETATQLPSGSLVLLVSVSETMMRIANKLISSNRGEEIPVRSVMPSDQKELNYMMKHANLVICDTSSEQAVLPIAGKVKVLVFHLYAPSTIELIKERIEKWG
jgi:DNA-binding transcriptional regulator YhcF (GntR family)